uniref:G_PROTEIN_RECEP_F1_2 domain-containing protein n=1 Tax=Panagrellus redivivus TaxID=6233 RepID=A0A7E4VTE3_PANRE
MPLYYDIDSSAVISYKLFLYVIAAITFTVTPVFIYAVVYKSSKLMSSYRALVLAYLPFSLISTVTITLSVPIFDYPSKLYHFYEKTFYFESTGAVFQLIFSLVIYISEMIITDLLLLMLIDRYDVVSKNVTTRPNWVFPFCYIVITISSIISIFVIFANIVLLVFDPMETIHNQFAAIKKLLMPITVFYQVSRLAGFITVIWLNINFGRKYASHASATVIRLHKMLTRSVIVNILCTAFFTRVPFILVTISYLNEQPTLTILSYNLVIALKHCAFLGNMVTTLYFVIPYRSFILRMFHMKISPRIDKVSIVHRALRSSRTSNVPQASESRRISIFIT